jgi:hypothetical protein
MRKSFYLLLVYSFLNGMTSVEAAVLNISGKIVSLPMEGGFYGVLGDDGKKYLPQNLPNMLQRHNLAVRIKAVSQANRLGIHQWGEYIQVLDVSPTCPLPEQK